MMNADQFDQLLGRIYDSALDPGAWHTILAELGHIFRCHMSGSVIAARDRSSVASAGIVGTTLEDHHEFLTKWFRTSAWGARVPPKRPGDITLTRDILPRSEFEQTAVYKGYYAAREMQEGLRMDLAHTDHTVQTLSLCRAWSAGTFAAEEVALARRIVPHLTRAATVSGHLRHAALRTDAATAALDGLGQHVLLLDRTGRILHATPMAEALLREQDGLSHTASGLEAMQPDLAVRLEDVVAQAAAEVPVGGNLLVQRPSGRAALALTVVPLGTGHDWKLPGQPAMLAYVNGPDPTSESRAEQLRAEFGMTRAEAELACDLLRGKTIRAIAQQTGRGVPTLRTHLARVLAKTATRRQVDLIGRLGRLPGFPSPGDPAPSPSRPRTSSGAGMPDGPAPRAGRAAPPTAATTRA